MTQEFTKYEKARILGARALQISMDAPLLLDIKKEELSHMNYDPLLIAEKELNTGVLPITVNRPLPDKGSEKDIKKIKIEDKSLSDEAKALAEQEAEQEIIENKTMEEENNENDDFDEEQNNEE